MCCDDEADGHQPLIVAQMLAEYRALHRDRPGFDWGDELGVDPPAARLPSSKLLYEYARFAPLADLVAAYRENSSWEQALRRTLQHKRPPSAAVVTVHEGGLHVTSGPAGWLLPGQCRQVALLIANDTSGSMAGSVGEERITVGAGGTRLVYAQLTEQAGAVRVAVGADEALVDFASPATGGELVLRSDATSRWSVTDASGCAWFPAGSLEKFDFHDRPFFYAREAVLAVPVRPSPTPHPSTSRWPVAGSVVRWTRPGAWTGSTASKLLPASTATSPTSTRATTCGRCSSEGARSTGRSWPDLSRRGRGPLRRWSEHPGRGRRGPRRLHRPGRTPRRRGRSSPCP